MSTPSRAVSWSPDTLPWFPIVGLHRVVDKVPNPNPYNLCIAPAGLERIIETLRRSGYRIVPLQAALRALDDGDDVRRLACLTFDDGYGDFYTHALPVLQRHSAPATVFLVADRLGDWNRWDEGKDGLPAVRLLTRDQVREAANRGVDFGSHSLTHADLVSLAADSRTAEIRDSKRAIEAILDREVALFAYPYWLQTREVQRGVADAGYLGAVGGEDEGHTRFLLHRAEVRRFDPVSLGYVLHGWRYRLRESLGRAKRGARALLGRSVLEA